MPHFETAHGCGYHYEVEGGGPPLILLHGSIQSAGEWRRAGWVDVLQAYRTLIMVDLMGHGQSDRPQARAAYEIEAQAKAVLGIADSLGHDRFEILGFSLGGRISYEIAARHSERLRALMIVAQHGRAPASEPRLAELIEAYRGGRLAAMERGLGIRPTPPARTVNDPEIMALTIEALMEWQGADVAIGKFEGSALVIAGEKDFAHDAASETAAAIPNAEFITLPGIEHSESFYKPDITASHVLRFIKALDDDATS